MLISRSYLTQFLDLSQISDSKIADIFNILGHEVENMTLINNPHLQPTRVLVVNSIIVPDYGSCQQVTIVLKNNQQVQVIASTNYLKVNDWVLYTSDVTNLAVFDAQDHVKTEQYYPQEHGLLCTWNMLGIKFKQPNSHKLIIFQPEDFNDNLSISFDLTDSIFELKLTYNRGDCQAARQLVLELAAFLQQASRIEVASIFKDFQILSKTKSQALSQIQCQIDQTLKNDVINLSAVTVTDVKLTGFSFKSIFSYSLLGLAVIDMPLLEQMRQITMYETGQLFWIWPHVLPTNKISVKLYNHQLGFKVSETEHFLLTSHINLPTIVSSFTLIAATINSNCIDPMSGLTDPNIDKTLTRLGSKKLSYFNYQDGLWFFLYKIHTSHGKITWTSYGENNPSPARPQIKIKLTTINQILGLNLTNEAIMKYLSTLQFKTTCARDWLTCQIPINRTNINYPWEIIEEVVRIHDVNQIPEMVLLPDMLINDVRSTSMNQYDAITDWLVNHNFMQAKTFGLTSSAEIDNFNFLQFNQFIAIHNPITSRRQILRVSLVNALLTTLIKNNAHQNYNCQFFTIDRIYNSIDEEQYLHNLALVSQGEIIANYSNNKIIETSFYYLKSILNELLSFIKIDQTLIKLKPYQITVPEIWFDPQQTFLIEMNNDIIGIIGAINETYANTYKLKLPCVFVELQLNQLLNPHNSKIIINKVPYHKRHFNIVSRDLSCRVPLKYKYNQLVSLLRNLDPDNLIRELSLKKIYQPHELVMENQKVITVTIDFYNSHCQISNKEVNDIIVSMEQQLKLILIERF